MAIILDIMNRIDGTVSGVAAPVFAELQTQIAPIVGIGSTLIIALLGINIATQTVPLTVRTFLDICIRIVLVTLFLNYSNISVPYEALTNAPSEFGAKVLNAMSGGAAGSLYEGVDDLFVSALEVGDSISQEAGWLAGALVSIFVFVIAASMAAVTIVVLGGAKIGIAILLFIAPIAVICTLFKQSAPIFEAWVKLAIGFSFVPLLVAAMAGFVLAAADAVSGDIAGAETLSDIISFIVVMIIGAGLMLAVPSLAQSLAATSIGLGESASRAAGWRSQATRGAANAARGGVAAARGQKLSTHATGSVATGFAVTKGAQSIMKLASKMKGG